MFCEDRHIQMEEGIASCPTSVFLSGESRAFWALTLTVGVSLLGGRARYQTDRHSHGGHSMSLSWILLLTCMAQALLVIIWILLSMNCAWKYRAKQASRLDFKVPRNR